MSDFNIVGKVQVDAGASAKSIADLKGEINEAKKALDNAKIGSKEYEAAQLKLKKSTDELNDTTSKSTGAFGKLKDGLGAAVPGFSGAAAGASGLGKQLWLLVANPIVLTVAAIVAGLGLLFKAFSSTEENGNKLGKGMSVLKGLFSGLLKVLEPIASFLVDGLVKGFELAGNAVIKLSSLIQKGLKALGLEAAAKGLNNLTTAVTENIKASKQLADAEAKLVESQRLSQKIQLDYQKQAEKLRQLRDDETKTISERIKINAQLGTVLKKQLNEELNIANQALAVADLRIKIEGKSTANLDERAAALTGISDIQERLSGQESEQLSNLNGLRREQNALIKEQRDEAVSYAKERQAEIAAFNKIETDLEAENEAIKVKNKEKADTDLLNRMKQSGAKLVQANQESNDQQKADDAILLETKKQNSLAATSLGNAALELFGRQSKVGKGIAAGMAAIDTFSAINKNLKTFSGVPVPGYAIAQAVATGIFGLLNVKKILSTNLPGGGGGGGGSAPSIPSAPAPVLPQQSSTSLNASSIQSVGNASQGGVNRSFVLDADISNNQERQARLARAARLS